MAPRLHRHVRHDQEEDQQLAQSVHGDGTTIPVIYADQLDLALLFDALGVNDLAALDGANDRTVRLSDRSELVCPAHDRTLKPDACRSCRFLAGET
jgi:hypothetical protein